MKKMSDIVFTSHSPAIEKGVYQMGTTTQLRLEYNTGPCEWKHGPAITNPEGEIEFIYSEWGISPELPRRREAVLATRKRHGG